MASGGKIVFVGNAESGKTFMAEKLILGEYYDSSVFWPYKADHHDRYSTIIVEGKKYVLLDTPGTPDRMQNCSRPASYYNAKIAFIFKGGEGTRSVQYWKDEIRKIAPNSIVFVVDINTSVENIRELIANVDKMSKFF